MELQFGCSSRSRGKYGRCRTSSTHDLPGSLRILISTTTRRRRSGTAPWDGAPAGHARKFAELERDPAPYGDIVALTRRIAHSQRERTRAARPEPVFPLPARPAAFAHPFRRVYYPLP